MLRTFKLWVVKAEDPTKRRPYTCMADSPGEAAKFFARVYESDNPEETTLTVLVHDVEDGWWHKYHLVDQGWTIEPNFVAATSKELVL